MKRVLLSTISLFFIYSGFSQNVGINATGANPDASAILDLSSTTKGLLIPRMTTADRSAITTPATGLVVYDTSLNSFYYYNGTSWQWLLSSGSGWNITGNAATVAGTNFIGTTDAIDFVTKTNNTERMRVTSTGNVGIGTNAPTSQFDINDAALNPRMRFRLNNGANGFTIGYNSGVPEAYIWNELNTRIVFGTNGAYRMTIDAVGNVGIGTNVPSVKLDISGSQTILRLQTPAANDYPRMVFNSSHTTIGGVINRDAAKDIYFGESSDAGKWIFRGTGALTAEGSVGIGTNTPGAKLEVAGQVKITGGAPGTGKVLISDAAGLATWATPGTATGDWGILGNAGTVAGTNFIGTTDAIDFVAKTNNTERMRITSGGAANIWSGGNYAIPNNFMAGGSLTLGNTTANFGGGNVWTANTAGLLMECLDNTEIAVHDASTRLASLSYYEGAANRINIGRDMGWGIISTIALNGDVGINTTTPANKLQVNSATNTSMVQTSNSTSGATANDGAVFGLFNNNAYLYNREAADLYFGTSNTRRMTITAGGNVGIGTAVITPAVPLAVGGVGANVYATDIWAENNIHVQGNEGLSAGGRGRLRVGTAWNYVGMYSEGSSTGATNDLVLGASSAWVRIGPNGGGQNLSIPSGQLILGVDNALKPGTSTWIIFSDERLKTINGTYTKGLAEILKLNTITYKYKNVGEKKFEDKVLETTQIGFSAQEVQKIFPEAVGVEADGYLNLNMHAILVAYTNAIKELDAKNKEQEQINNDLKKRLEKLEALLEKSK